ncbi:MAG: undecaprenyl-diphosphate phosphatase [Clostridia bacterium]|nr:undecaprenyl-diphosphate phosphatase [Clostridia bacterium]
MIFIAIILGLIQGITEFLPISSSGHLVLVEKLFGIECDFTLLNVILHLATLFAVILYYRKVILYLICHPFCKMNKFLLIATLPAVIFVLLFHSFIDNYLSSSIFLGIGFILSAIFIYLGVSIPRNTSPQSLKYSNVLIMGISQAFAIFPGLSRSGTTLCFGLLAGVERQSALDFSFLMSIPIILASLIYEVFSSPVDSIEPVSAIISFVTAFITAFLTIKLMKKIIKNKALLYFVPYLILLGILSFVLI